MKLSRSVRTALISLLTVCAAVVGAAPSASAHHAPCFEGGESASAATAVDKMAKSHRYNYLLPGFDHKRHAEDIR